MAISSRRVLAVLYLPPSQDRAAIKRFAGADYRIQDGRFEALGPAEGAVHCFADGVWQQFWYEEPRDEEPQVEAPASQ